MYLVTVLFRTSQQLFQFHFDQFKDAGAVLRTRDSTSEIVEISDDYGSKAVITKSEIAGIILTDLDREMTAQESVEWAKTQFVNILDYNKDVRLQKKVQENIWREDIASA